MPKTPGSLDEALDNLEKDHEFLLQGDVFTQDVISTWIWYKTREGSGRHAAAAASVRVLPVLRHLTFRPAKVVGTLRVPFSVSNGTRSVPTTLLSEGG